MNLDPNALIYIPYPRVNCLKTIHFRAGHTYIAHIWQYPHPGDCNTSTFSVRLRYHLLRTARDLRVLPFISRPWERAYGTKSLHSTASIRPSAGITPLFMKVTIFVLASIFSHFPVQSTTSQQIPIILRTRTKLIKRYRY